MPKKTATAATEAEVTYDADQLAADVASLQGKLEKAEQVEETETLVKSLANVAEGVIDVAKEALGAKKKGKKAAQAETLAKAAKAKKDDDEDDDDEDDDDSPDWLKKMTREEKGAGEMIYAYDRDETETHSGANAGGESKPVGKSRPQSTRLAGDDVIDVEGYLDDSLREQKRLRKAVAVVAEMHETRLDALAKGLTALLDRVEAMATTLAHNMLATGMITKALGKVIENQEEVLAAPADSKFEAMRKSVKLVQADLKANGGTQVPYDKERAGRALMKGQITNEQHRIWKNTDMLPAGVSIN